MALDEAFLMDDDDIFFGLPEEEVNFLEIDYIWDSPEEDLDPKSKKSKGKKGKKDKKDDPKPPRIPCPHCHKTYANQRTLKTHLNGVALKDAITRVPSYDGLMNKMKELCIQALEEVKESLTVGDLALQCSSYAKSLKEVVSTSVEKSYDLLDFLSELFGNVCSDIGTVTLTSKFRGDFIIHTNQVLNREDVAEKMVDLCFYLVECEKNVFNYFWGCFFLKLSDKVLVYVCQCMQASVSVSGIRKKRSTDDLLSEDFIQLVHYIGGSVVAGVFRRKRNYPNAIKTALFVDTLKESFLENKDDDSTCCDQSIREWTASQDRGRLCYISVNAFKFFYELISFIMTFEEEDGSLLLSKVQQAVSESFNLFVLWDTLVEVSVSDDTSLEWLSSVVEVLCKCVSKGIIKRRLGEALQKKSHTSVAFRAKLSR